MLVDGEHVSARHQIGNSSEDNGDGPGRSFGRQGGCVAYGHDDMPRVRAAQVPCHVCPSDSPGRWRISTCNGDRCYSVRAGEGYCGRRRRRTALDPLQPAVLSRGGRSTVPATTQVERWSSRASQWCPCLAWHSQGASAILWRTAPRRAEPRTTRCPPSPALTLLRRRCRAAR